MPSVWQKGPYSQTISVFQVQTHVLLVCRIDIRFLTDCAHNSSSIECQRENWHLHKQFCAEHSEALGVVDDLKASGNMENGQLMSDWITWRTMQFPDKMRYARVHALRLGRDSNRGRTHIVFTEVHRVANSKHPARRFEAVKMGVFRLADVYKDIESLMGREEGESQQMINEMLDEFDHRGSRNSSHPFFELYFSADKRIQVWLSIASISRIKLNELSLDPDWRKDANHKGVTPQPITILNSGATDAENDIDS